MSFTFEIQENKLLTQQTIGFLFDVDGTLTYYQENDSVIDQSLIDTLNYINRKKMPIGLVTGRSVIWVQDHLFDYLTDDLKKQIRVFGEFGLVFWNGEKIELSKISDDMKLALAMVRKEVIAIFLNEKNLKAIVSYEPPNQKCLWIEPKDCMVTFRTLQTFGLTIDHLLEIVKPIFEKYSAQLKMHYNPLAIDIIPNFASKQYGAEAAIKALDPNNKIEQWYAFGDSESDKGMSKAKNGLVEFHLVPREETKKVHELLQKILAKHNL
ncbi:MAG: HAD-IIB family hydrolase [Candidatus Heimdallarchaeota archaeon]|nr:HAD-IIB family hydrolase [Candidatus Heimdallarchaeota archaeon]